MSGQFVVVDGIDRIDGPKYAFAAKLAYECGLDGKEYALASKLAYERDPVPNERLDGSRYALAAKHAYERALEENDADALAIEKNAIDSRSDPARQENRKPCMSGEALNKVIAFSLKKIVGYVVGVASKGAVNSALTDYIVDFMADIAGVQMPKDGQALVLERIDMMEAP